MRGEWNFEERRDFENAVSCHQVAPSERTEKTDASTKSFLNCIAI